jgi:hypothetical protein
VGAVPNNRNFGGTSVDPGGIGDGEVGSREMPLESPRCGVHPAANSAATAPMTMTAILLMIEFLAHRLEARFQPNSGRQKLAHC